VVLAEVAAFNGVCYAGESQGSVVTPGEGSGEELELRKPNG
jgi:hypothetical protein